MALQFGTMSRRGQWGVIGFVCLVMAGVFYVYIWQPMADDISVLTTQINNLRLEIERTRAVAERLPELEQELERLEQRLETLSIILPEGLESDLLLRRVEAAALDSNLNVSRAAFQATIPHDFYAEYPFTLQVVGTYHDLARFFDRVGKFARIINIDEVSIQALENDAQGNTISASCTAKTFFFLEEQATAPATAQPGTTPGGPR